MKTKSRIIHAPPAGATYGTTVLLIGMLAYVGWVLFSFKIRIDKIHSQIFHTEAPLSYSLDLENLGVIASARIQYVPKLTNSKWKDLPFFSESHNFRIEHRLNLYQHAGTLELKVSDNNQKGSFVSSDVKIDFVAESNQISFSISPFDYEAPESRLSFGPITGTFSEDGEIKLTAKTLDLKMVSYLFRFGSLSLIIPSDRNAFEVSSGSLAFDEVEMGNTKISFTGADPFEIRLNSTFEGKPAEIRWSIQKTKIKDQEVKVGSGRMRFPASLIDAYVLPKINRTLIAEKKESSGIASDKARFLEAASHDVRRAEARSVTLRLLGQNSSIRREGEFYDIRRDKQDAFKALEESGRKSAVQKEYLESWLALPKEKMYEEAFYALIFGDETRAEAVKELLVRKEFELKNDPEYLALKARLLLRDSVIRMDENDPSLVSAAEDIIHQLAPKMRTHLFLPLLALELAIVKKNRKEAGLIVDSIQSKVSDPQLLELFKYLKHLHVDDKAALAALEKANTINPNSLYVQNLIRHRIHVNHHLENQLKVEEDYRILVEHNPTANDLLAYSDLLESKREYDKSLAVIQKCIDQDYQNQDCHNQKESVMAIVAIEMQKKGTDAAIDYLLGLLVDRPASIAANAALGFLYHSKGDNEKSISAYSVACALGGALACIEAADFLSRLGQQDRSLLLYDISCDLKSGSGCLKAGLLFEKINRRDMSESFFARSCEEFHDNVGCYHFARSLQIKKAPNRSIATYLNKACKLYSSACKLATVYQTTNKQPEIPLEPK